MIGGHYQNSPNGWPIAAAKLPPNAMNKFVTGLERARESKAVNPDVATWYRWVGEQPLPHDNVADHCRRWLDQFVDGTFRAYSQYIDYTQEYNETLANSQSKTEKALWINLHTTMAKVWAEEYRPNLAGNPRLILCETAIGNDIPIEIAAAAAEYDCPIGWHPYVVCRVGKIVTGQSWHVAMRNVRYDAPRAEFRPAGGEVLYKMVEGAYDGPRVLLSERAINRPDFVSPHDWQWYSGRWATMDAEWRKHGIHVDWCFGEGGPVLDASENWSGWLDPLGGWKNPDCLGGSIEKYEQVLDYWLQNTFREPAYKEGRIKGYQLFTSGAPGSGPTWKNFDLVGDDMQRIADFTGNYTYPPTGEPPIDPPDPDPDPPEGGFKQELWDESIRLQTIQLNPNAALQSALYADDYVPVESEFWYAVDDVQYAAQAAEHLDTGERRVYYAVVPHWNIVKWFTDPQDWEIVDVVEQMPKHPDKVYKLRTWNEVDTIVIHHTVTPDDFLTENIAHYHIQTNDWPGIGYHYVVDHTGKIEQVNYNETVSYHARQVNGNAIGIALKGDFTNSPPTDEQLAATKWLVNYLRGVMPITEVLGHRDVPGASTSCPGNTWLEWKGSVV